MPGKLETDRRRPQLARQGEEDFIRPASASSAGWCWLAVQDGRIVVMKTPNGENPLVHGAEPILGCDVWEHAYYIDYRNRRPDYLKAFLDHLVSWEHVAEMLESTGKTTASGNMPA